MKTEQVVETHRKNILHILVNEIRERMQTQSLSTDQAFVRVAANWLGYNSEDDYYFIDGAGDHGIDFWFSSTDGFDLFQVKSRDFNSDGDFDFHPFDSDGVKDLFRMRNFLLYDDGTATKNQKLFKLKHEWAQINLSRRLEIGEEIKPIPINLGLVILGTSLSSQAEKEFREFEESIKSLAYLDKIPIEFALRLYTINDLLITKWRELNREWKDSKGNKKESISLTPKKQDDYISDTKSALFYCQSIDLVNAFGEFGYQIFEPNVRCKIIKSPVNLAIRESLKHRITRQEFQFLNNGVTIVCNHFEKPSANREKFRVYSPGVINGLQTVVTLFETYGDLRDEEKRDFEKDCYVLVRILTSQAVKDLNRVVKSTNNQNAMKARNLVSNEPEQILYEKLFAELEWFYERKEGAWEAFAADPKRWRTLSNKTKNDFKSTNVIRRIDNEVAAQTWLSFIGFSNEAVHDKKSLFDEKKGLYDLIFLHRPIRHGSDYRYNYTEACQESDKFSSSPGMILVSYLCREFAKKMAPSGKENRDDAIQRLKLQIDKVSTELIDARLAEDNEYLLGQVLNGMSFVFVEFLGLILFKAYGEKIHNIGYDLLGNGSLRLLAQSQCYDEVKQKVKNQDCEENDILYVTWHTFRHILEGMLGSPWKQSYLTARSRTQFNHDVDTRSRIKKELEDFNEFTSKKQLTKLWAAGIKEGEGLIGFIKRAITQ